MEKSLIILLVPVIGLIIARFISSYSKNGKQRTMEIFHKHENL